MQQLRWSLRNLLATTTLLACFMAIVKTFEMSLSRSLLLAVVIIQQVTLCFKDRLPRRLVQAIIVVGCIVAIVLLGQPR